MTDEDQERYKAYLELEEYIEALQAGSAAHPPAHVTAEQLQIYRMAAFFCSASPCAAEPSAEFADALYARLLTMEKEANDDRPVTHWEQPAHTSEETMGSEHFMTTA